MNNEPNDVIDFKKDQLTIDQWTNVRARRIPAQRSQNEYFRQYSQGFSRERQRSLKNLRNIERQTVIQALAPRICNVQHQKSE